MSLLACGCLPLSPPLSLTLVLEPQIFFWQSFDSSPPPVRAVAACESVWGRGVRFSSCATSFGVNSRACSYWICGTHRGLTEREEQTMSGNGSSEREEQIMSGGGGTDAGACSLYKK